MKKTTFIYGLLITPFFVLATTLDEKLSSIEQRISGKVGVSVLDTRDQSQWHYNGDERFPMMSTFKTLACAKMLQDADNGLLDLGKKTRITSDEIIDWSPVTQEWVGGTITLEKACEASMLTSDNTAVNIVLQNIGGPQGVTTFLRTLGDEVTQLDRIEPELNQAIAGDVRDTTTPNAMNTTLERLLLGDGLSQHAQNRLRGWMQSNSVSDSLLRSILPQGWSIADRSGAGGFGSRGITALIWAEQRAPMIISIYMTQTDLSLSERNSIINDIGQQIFSEYSVENQSELHSLW